MTIVLTCIGTAQAQNQPGAPLGLPGEKKEDSTAFKKSNTDDWGNVDVKVQYKYLHSKKIYTPDTSIHTFHRKAFSQPWYIDLGNFGTPMRNLMFTPDNRLGPTLGYHAFDVYRMDIDSLHYYNTTAPYSLFSFNLGSKLEQKAHILHTQNIKPNWNVAAGYTKVVSEGYFLLQRTNQDHGMFSTNYESVNRRYKLNAGVTYNKMQQDENGGIVDTSQLTNPDFNDRSTIDIVFANAGASAQTNIPRSLVTNVLRDYNILVNQSYAWGKTDTLYNEDSTSMNLLFTPRFSISHQLKITNKQLTYKDLAPDSLRYDQFFQYSLDSDSDSVYCRQKHNMIDNQVLLNGFLGRRDKQLQFSTGIGMRVDQFSTRNGIVTFTTNSVSNYIVGRLQKEALEEGEWFYNADAVFFITGIASGNSLIKATVGKELGNRLGTLEAGVQQNINNAPYNYTNYYSNFDTILNSFNKESITRIFADVKSDRFKLRFGASSYLISNYLYMNMQQLADQYAPAFNITQVWLQKMFTWRGVVFDNEVLYQQSTAGAPVNIPQLLGRHQLSYERYIFKKALKVAVGVEARYHSKYNSAQYSPIYNRFYYQDTLQVSNMPAASVFFNFKIKRFRAYLMLDQGQQFFYPNLLTAPGYPAQNAMIRFGFNWIMLK